jgi:hypothetical protein
MWIEWGMMTMKDFKEGEETVKVWEPLCYRLFRRNLQNTPAPLLWGNHFQN